jgi:hypothetical protein
MGDEDIRELYQTASDRKGVPLFALTVADFLNPPAIHQVDDSAYTGQEGQTIKIITADDFGVVNVHVTLADNQGQVFESGQANETSQDSGRWEYVTTNEVPAGATSVNITVVATDRPGGVANVSNIKAL